MNELRAWEVLCKLLGMLARELPLGGAFSVGEDIGDSFILDIRGGAGDTRYILDMRAQIDRQI